MRYGDRCLSRCGGSTDGAQLPEVRSLSVRAVRIRPAARPAVPCSRKSGRSPLVQFDRRLLAPKGFTAVFRFRSLRYEPPFLQVSAVRVPRPVHLKKSLPRNGFERAQPPSADPDGKQKRTINPKMRNQFIIARQRISVIWLFQRNFNQLSALKETQCTKTGRFSRKTNGFPKVRTPAGRARGTDGGSNV